MARFEKGKSGNPKGRPSGSLNKVTIVKDVLKAIGCDPVLGVAEFAMDESNDKSLRFAAYKELMKYCHSTIRSSDDIDDMQQEVHRLELHME